MKMTWSVGGPKTQRVRLELSITGRERVWVDGVEVSRKMNWGARSEHDVPLVGRTAKLIVHSNGLTARGELFVDGAREEPDARPVESVRPQRSPFDSPPKTPAPQESTWSIGIRVACGVLGAIIGRSLGFALLIPVACWLLTAFVCSRLAPERSRPLVPAVGVLGGHVGWMTIGLVTTAQLKLPLYQDTLFEGLFLEIGLFSILGIVLLASASPLAILATGLLELLGIASNLMSLGDVGADTAWAAKALSLAVVLRGSIVVLLFQGWKELSAPEPGPALTEGLLGARRGPAVGEWTNCDQCALEHRVSTSLRCPRCDVAYR